MSVTAIPNGLSRPRERWSRRKAILYNYYYMYSETAPLVHDSGAAREDDGYGVHDKFAHTLQDVYTTLQNPL